ncbi:MAG TPA: rod shape-determining protein MreC [Chloroflexota bacterium]|nr:rod shape-determining protein MreC [Chloroflexota bacterium]
MLNRLFTLVLLAALAGAIILVARTPQAQFVETLIFEVLSPVETVLAGPATRVNSVGQTITGIATLRSENERLRAQVDRLSQEAVLVPELQRQNAELQAQLGFHQDNPQYQWVNAHLLGYDSSNLVQSIIVDRGTSSGVADGMTVITPRGLVGQVIEVTPTTAKVLLITDVSSSADALIQSNRAKGVVNGSRTGTLTMMYIPQQFKVQTGDRVVTSGLGGVFPPGFWVGTVTDVRQNDVDLFQTARLEPAVDFGRLEDVMIITNHLPVKLR